jgi:hypothetical protein
MSGLNVLGATFAPFQTVGIFLLIWIVYLMFKKNPLQTIIVIIFGSVLFGIVVALLNK